MDLYGALGGDFFTAPTPTAYPSSGNTSSASLSASIGNLASLTGKDIVMSYDGSTWSARDAATGTALSLSGSGTSADPFVVDGVNIVVGGSAAAGDSFLVRPASEGARQIGLAITDPSRIAAASPLRGSAALGNLGNAKLGAIDVLDASNPTLLNPVTIQFTGPNTYSINGSGSYTYTSGAPISINGWQVTLSGTPVTGDSFSIGPNGPGSSDNTNARVFAGLSGTGLFDGGVVSLTQATSQLVSSVGGTARQAANALTAQQAIDDQLQAERESVSGVNLDEEATNLLRFQQAYQAAAQIITTANETFQSLLAAMQR